MFSTDSGIYADKERVRRNNIGVGQVSNNPARDASISRVAQEVPSKEVARLDPVSLQIACEIVPSEARFGTNRYNESEPQGIGMLGCMGEDQPIQIGLDDLFQLPEISLSKGGELFKLLKLSAANRCLHIRHFEIIADMAINILVIVSGGKRSKLLSVTLSASVILSSCTIAVPAPVPE